MTSPNQSNLSAVALQAFFIVRWRCLEIWFWGWVVEGVGGDCWKKLVCDLSCFCVDIYGVWRGGDFCG